MPKRELSAPARGDAEARFSRLYEENWEDLLADALRRAAAPEDAADLVAETLLVAWRRLGNVPPEAALHCPFCRRAGLLRRDRSPKPAWRALKRLAVRVQRARESGLKR